MTPLIPRMLKHAFLSGFVAGKYSDPKDEGAGAQRWVEYEPHEKDLAKLLRDEAK